MTAGRIPPAMRDALARQDALFIGGALIPGDPRSSEAHLRHTARLLGDRQTRSPSARVVSHLVALFERSVTPAQRGMLACRSGCSFCCRQPVAVTAPEAFFIAAQLYDRPDTAAAMAALAAAALDRTPDQKGVAWFACPLLDGEGGCSVYRARPLACHAQVSVDVADCRDGFGPGAKRTVMEPRGYTPLKDHCRMILLAAMRVHGLPLVFYEMNAAVAAVQGIDNAEKRWLRGEAVFGDLRTITPLAPQAAQTIDWMARTIAATL